MKTKEQFLTEYADKLRGFLMRGFITSNKPDAEIRGREMQAALNSIDTLLTQMHDFMAETVPAPAPMPELTFNDQANALVKRAKKMPMEQQELVYNNLMEKLKPTPNVTNGANGTHPKQEART